jgi:DNA-binding MarR family transcriptional regulator
MILTVNFIVYMVGGVDATDDEVALPALLRAARRTYGVAIRAAQLEEGFDDVPRNGSYVLGAIARTGTGLSEVIEALGVSKQAGGQLVDTLVARGYLERTPDTTDRRRLVVALTERGRAAAASSRAAVERVDAGLVERVGQERVVQAREALWALVAMRAGWTAQERTAAEVGAERERE